MSEPKAKPAGPSDAPHSSGLMARTFNGFLWAFAGAGSQAVLKIVVLGVLARLLTPDQFGVVSAATTVVALAELFGRVGVAPAVIQARNLDEAMIRTASTITICTGLLSGAVLFLAAPLMARLFQIETIEQVIRGFSLIFLVRGFSVVPEALLQREMRFRATAFVDLGSYLFGYALVGISMAEAGFGIWALVWGQVAQTVLSAVAFIVLCRPSMRPMLHGESLKPLFRYGAGVTLSKCGNYIALNADYFIVGRWLGADALGYYSRAYVLLVQQAQLLGTVGEKVLFPALSSAQENQRQLLRGYYRAVSLIAMTTIPLSGTLVILSPELIRILLGSQWGTVVLPFQVLLVSLVFRTAYKVEGTLLRARGTVYLMAMWQWFYAGLVIVGAISGVRWGIVGVSIGVSIAIFVAYWVGVLITKLSSPISVRTHAAIFSRYIVVALMIVVPLYFLRGWLVSLGLHDIVVVAACSALAGTIFLAAFQFLGKLFGEEGIWIRNMITPYFNRILRRS